MPVPGRSRDSIADRDHGFLCLEQVRVDVSERPSHPHCGDRHDIDLVRVCGRGEQLRVHLGDARVDDGLGQQLLRELFDGHDLHRGHVLEMLAVFGMEELDDDVERRIQGRCRESDHQRPVIGVDGGLVAATIGENHQASKLSQAGVFEDPLAGRIADDEPDVLVQIAVAGFGKAEPFRLVDHRD